MDFKSVELKKFLSHLSSKVIFKDSGLVLIEGDNGAGKTSILDAISWGIFGKTIRGIKDDNVVHLNFKADTEVIVNLVKNNYAYKIRRYRKHSEFKNRLMYEKKGLITRDIINVEEGTLDLTQAKLLRDLDIDFDLFRCTVLFGQEETFNFINETNAEQKKILSKIMRVDFSKYLANAKAELKTSTERLIDVDRKLAVLRSHEGDPEEKYREDVARWEERRESSLKAIKKEIKDFKEAISETEKRVAAHDVARYKELQTTIREKLAALDDIDHDTGGAKAQVEHLESQLKRYQSLQKAGKCPTCETPIKDDKCKQEIEKFTKMVAVARQAHGVAIEQREELKEKRNKFMSRAESIKDKLYEAADEIKTLKEENEALSEARGRLKEEEAEENPFTAKIAEEKSRQGEIKKKIKDLAAEEEELKERVPYLDFWIKGFGDDGIKSFIFDLICASLTEKTNLYLNTLTGGDIQVSFDTQKKLKTGELRDKFTCDVIFDGKQLPYENYSGGQKTRISLAVDMALSDLMSDRYGSKFNIVAFDEQTTYMNEKGRRGFMSLLTKVSEKRGVYVVDHDAEFKRLFDDVITVKMKDGVSHVSV